MNALRFFFIIALSLFIVPAVTALSVFNIYLDDTGDAIFLGETDETSLPEGLQIAQNGEVVGVTSVLTQKNGDRWTFSYSLDDSELTVFLPPAATITSVGAGSIFVEDDRIVVKNDDSITVTYETGIVETKPLPLHILWWFLALLVGLIIIVYATNWFNREKKKPVVSERLESLRGILSDREQKIIDTLKELGKVKSSYLRQQLNMPKASFSRHLQELERKKLIKRSGEGRNKLVELIT